MRKPLIWWEHPPAYWLQSPPPPPDPHYSGLYCVCPCTHRHTWGSKQTLRASLSVDLFPPELALSTQTYKSLSAQVPRKSGHRCPLLHSGQWSILGSEVPCFGGMVLAPLWPRPIKIMSVSGPAWPRASNCDIRSSLSSASHAGLALWSVSWGSGPESLPEGREHLIHNSSVAQPQKLSGTAFLGPGHMSTLKQVTEIKGDKICSLPRSRLYAQFLILIL